MKILWLTTDRSQRVAQLFTPLQREVSKLADVTIHEGGIWKRREYWERGYDPVPDLDYANSFDVVFTDAVFAFRNNDFWPNVTAYKAVLIEDCHGNEVADYVHMAFRKYRFDLFFYRYRDGFAREHGQIPMAKKTWLPHSIDPEVFGDWQQEKEYGALLTGSMARGTYQTRLLIDDSLKFKGYYKRIERPREHKDGTWPRGIDYAKEINKALVAFATGSKYGYPVAKYFEIPACKTALMGQWMPEMDALGFVPFINFYPLSDSNIEGQVETVLKDKDQLAEVTQRGFEFVHKEHSAQVRAKQFVKKLESRL